MKKVAKSQEIIWSEFTLYDFFDAMAEKKHQLISRCAKPVHSMEKLPFFCNGSCTAHKSNNEARFSWIKWQRAEKNGKEISMSIESIENGANFFFCVIQCHKYTNFDRIWSSETYLHSEIEAKHVWLLLLPIELFIFQGNNCSYVSIYFCQMVILCIHFFPYLSFLLPEDPRCHFSSFTATAIYARTHCTFSAGVYYWKTLKVLYEISSLNHIFPKFGLCDIKSLRNNSVVGWWINFIAFDICPISDNFAPKNLIFNVIFPINFICISFIKHTRFYYIFAIGILFVLCTEYEH